MDEPCSALDPISTSAIEDLIHELSEWTRVLMITATWRAAARGVQNGGELNLQRSPVSPDTGDVIETSRRMLRPPLEAEESGEAAS